MSSIPLLKVSGSGAEVISAAFYPQHFEQNQFVLVTADLTTTGAVLVQGRMDSDFDWFTIHTFNSSGYQQVSKFPEMRLVLALSAGEVASAAIMN